VTVLAVIGGTGADYFPGRKATQEHVTANVWGQLSAPIEEWEAHGHRVLFLARHGTGGGIPPHRVNYRANLQGLREAGAEQIIALNAVGGISISAGKLMVPDQLIDYTWGRGHSYYDSAEAPIEFIDFTKPYSDILRNGLIKACARAGVAVTSRGTYGVTQGPRLETAAEIDRLERDGCDVVGMTAMPEAALARELGIPYAALAMTVNAAAGRDATHGIHADIARHIKSTVADAARVIDAYLGAL